MSAIHQKQILCGLDDREMKELVVQEGIPAFRAKQLLEWIYDKNIAQINEAKNLPKDLLKRLSQKYQATSLALVESRASSDQESTKYLFRTEDDHLLESVLIVQQNRRTVCVSTQLGCKIGCTFCASGKGKFIRNLTAGEIIEQVAFIQKETKKKVTNVVFMGMGEPLDNFKETMKALKILQASWGFELGARRITVSTSGITPKILEFVQCSEGRVRLSVSLHAVSEKLRSELVPINKKYSLKALIDALRQIHGKLKREITFEYTLINGINDSVEDARGLGKIAKSLNAKVNIIPYNTIRDADYQTPSDETIKMFKEVMHEHQVRITIRQTAGRDINAACGQLRLEHLNKKQPSRIKDFF